MFRVQGFGLNKNTKGFSSMKSIGFMGDVTGYSGMKRFGLR